MPYPAAVQDDEDDELEQGVEGGRQQRPPKKPKTVKAYLAALEKRGLRRAVASPTVTRKRDCR